MYFPCVASFNPVALLQGSPAYSSCITEVEKAAERLESLSQMTQLDTGASPRVQTRSHLTPQPPSAAE